jgi:NDP-sugar pyrophosphorylase family protein
MKAVLLDAGRPASLEPVTSTRDLALVSVANVPLRAWQRAALAGYETAAPLPGERALYIRGDAWVSAGLLAVARETGGPVRLADARGGLLAWIGTEEEPASTGVSTVSDEQSFRIVYPWDLLRANAAALGWMKGDSIAGHVSKGVTIEGRLALGEGSRILPGVYIEGNVAIGSHCKIGPNCYLRGSTSIGDHCHIGQAVEIKNSIVLGRTSIGHLSYCGDSVVCERVNFGAGTITANFRHDGGMHRSMVVGELVDTCLRKLGAVLGDDVHTGIHTSIYPGRKMWPGVSTLPGSVVRRDIAGPDAQ